MYRVQIDLPDQFAFTTLFQVRMGDLSIAKHLASHILVSYLTEATYRFLNECGFESFEIDGLAFIQADLAVSYHSESFHGDSLSVSVALDELTKHGCNFFFRVTNQRTGLLVAKAKMAMLFFDYKNKKLGVVPPCFKAVFEKFCFLPQN